MTTHHNQKAGKTQVVHWTTEEPWFDSRQTEEVLLSSANRTAHPSTEATGGSFSGKTLALYIQIPTDLHLVQRLRTCVVILPPRHAFMTPAQGLHLDIIKG
jgi:hypothetical protein